MNHYGAIQKNDYGNHMLVSTNKSANTFTGQSFRAELSKKPLTDEEIISAYEKYCKRPSIEQMKSQLMKIEGFCKSNCRGKDNSFTYGDLFSYEKLL